MLFNFVGRYEFAVTIGAVIVARFGTQAAADTAVEHRPDLPIEVFFQYLPHAIQLPGRLNGPAA